MCLLLANGLICSGVCLLGMESVYERNLKVMETFVCRESRRIWMLRRWVRKRWSSLNSSASFASRERWKFGFL